jgi:competence/damage-inducible protein CinA-like protein
MSIPAPLRTAEVIAVGSEMLGSARLDTNSLFIAEHLSRLGIELRAKSVVGDDRGDLAALLRQALERVDLVVLTGGLGPTDDDLTREAVADVLNLPLDVDAEIVTKIEQRFARRGLRMPEVNRKQAQVLRGATVLANAKGTAPGLLVEHGDRVVLLLPGPPREMQPMFEALCQGFFAGRAGRERLYRATLFITGRTESHVEEIAQPLYASWRDATPPISTTILATAGQIELHLTARDANDARGQAAVDRARDDLHRALGEDVFSNAGEPLEEVVGRMLRARGYTIAAAESCTGGLLTSRLTDVAGSSDYVRASVVAYSNEAKETLLGVPHDTLVAQGAVSEPVALAMADGIRSRTGADVAVSITGIAGPGGGSPQKPVGTVVIAVLVPGQPADVRTHTFFGDRLQVKFHSSQAALDRVRRMLS